MMNVAFIPVRGGSKSIPLKNIKPIAGKPLVYWVIKAACECRQIDKVYVATDSDEIRKVVEAFKGSDKKDDFAKIKVIGRSAESASDIASTESAMLEFAESYDFDNIVLIQATSPLLSSEDLERGFKEFDAANTDSVISVVRQKRFYWRREENGNVVPENYDVYHRPRRQDFTGNLVENGAFYITSKENLLHSRNRVSGNIKAVEMKEDTFYEIDEPDDWIVVESLINRNNDEYGDRFFENNSEIKLFLTDCDGCLTDGGMYYSEEGDELKKFNTRDGMAFRVLREKGILTGIITSECVELNKRRAEKLGLDIFLPGCLDKLEAAVKICDEKGISLAQVVYVGDDINDLEILKNVGFSCCPADAVEKVKGVCKYIAETEGGKGVIREIVDMIVG